uniref:Uncharacterized protein n=1 Tax=Caenorhabditis japonica TaxID=281687 RepID=A0A8R1DPA0_CAEJA
MSPPSRKKKPKGAESPPTDDIQVVDFTGRHTETSCESGPVLAAGGSNQPLCDSPVPLLEASAVAPASAVSTARTHNSLPVSTPVSEIGHPPTISSSSHTAASDASDIRQQPDIELDSDYDIEIDVSDQEEYFPPPPEDSMQEVSDPLEPDFAAPIIIQGVQVPAKQKRHPFDGLYAPREGEEPPKDVTKRLVTSIVLSQIHSFRTKSLEWFIPIEKLNTPELAPAETDPVQVVSIPSTPFALYVLHTHYGSSASLSPVHRELTADDRPDLLYIQFSPRYARESTTGHAHDMGKFYAGDLLAVIRIGRLPDTTDEHFVRSHEGALQAERHNFWTVLEYTLIMRTIAPHTIAFCARKHRSRDACHLLASDFPVPIQVPQKFSSGEKRLRPGCFYRAKILTPQAQPASLLHNIVPGSAKQHVVRLTNPLALRHKFRPTLINATTPSPDDNRLLQLANNPYGTLDVSN